MAEPERPTTLAATFPSPPPFYKHFTQENTKKVNELRAAQEVATGSQPESTKLSKRKSPSLPTRILDLPPELLFLQPPLPPADGIYRNFGDRYTLKEELPSLAEQGIKQLYETPPATPSGTDNHQDLGFILKKLAKSLLLNFMELIGILGLNPELADGKIDDLRTHFINIHHLLNQYRPHEARESLILQMEEQVRRAKAETEGIYAMKRNVNEFLDDLRGWKLPILELPANVKAQLPVDENKDGYDAWEQLMKDFGSPPPSQRSKKPSKDSKKLSGDTKKHSGGKQRSKHGKNYSKTRGLKDGEIEDSEPPVSDEAAIRGMEKVAMMTGTPAR